MEYRGGVLCEEVRDTNTIDGHLEGEREREKRIKRRHGMDGFDWACKDEVSSNPHHHIDAYLVRGETLSRVHRNYGLKEIEMTERKNTHTSWGMDKGEPTGWSCGQSIRLTLLSNEDNLPCTVFLDTSWMPQ